MATIPERLATLEAKVDTLTLNVGTIHADVRTLLIRDIERSVVAKYTSRIARAVPWAALATAAIAIVRGA